MVQSGDFFSLLFLMVFVSLSGDFLNFAPITILQNTGLSQSCLLVGALLLCSTSFTGTNALMQGVDSPLFCSIVYWFSDRAYNCCC